MSLLTGETEVFQAANDGRCAVVFLAKRRGGGDASAVLAELDRLRDKGWLLSLDHILDTEANEPSAYATGFTHDVDFAGMFEAPSQSAAHAGIAALERAGWARLLRTEWLTGPREFLPVISPASRGTRDEWGFFALWKWNAAWQAASEEQRREYDLECDIAFASDVRAGAAIAGRHRLDVASEWDHIGVWRIPGADMLDAAMREHDRVADFKFTTSRHYLGKRIPLEKAITGENA
ncbi:hypothetical protein [Sciscionella sediminilitoris]|uniref:hypothetical protein n=1 Tax=Sciscionella sediminilitoris TaxID=1445613 RepID=UPI0004DF684A|nr:hypothetical protein [Sciscionella sp. SE31]